MYEEAYNICLNVEDVMCMFSKELQELDRNTVQYMIEEQQELLNEQQEQLHEQRAVLNEQQTVINTLKAEIQALKTQLDKRS